MVYITASLTRLYIVNLQLHFLCGNYTARGVLLHSPSIRLTLFTLYYSCAYGSRNSVSPGIWFVAYSGLYSVSTGYQPYRQAIAGFLCFTLVVLSP